jgi:hypothetical protein
MDLELVNNVDVDKMTPEQRDKLKGLLQRVVDGDGFKLTAIQERAGGAGRLRLFLEFEPDPNPANFVTYRPLLSRR